MRPPHYPAAHPKGAGRLTVLRKGEEAPQHSQRQDRQHVTKQAQQGSHVSSLRHGLSSPPRKSQANLAVLDFSSDEKPP